jgi:type II secretory ATPase GspE/PulE/Tfp pilus assembly ATPase PilB-like protein
MPAGLILISGPSLSGRHTTLSALLSELNRDDKNIYLLTAAPEENIAGLNALPPTAVNWDRLLHHDCDIIAANDLDDPADLERALSAANTGRLILGVMTADSVWEGLQNILSLPLPLKLKLDSLKIVTNQRLVKMQRKKSGHRSNKRQEIALFELFKLTPSLKKFILKNEELIDSRPIKKARRAKFWKELAALAQEEGFKPLALDEREKIKTGILAPDNL